MLVHATVDPSHYGSLADVSFGHIGTRKADDAQDFRPDLATALNGLPVEVAYDYKSECITPAFTVLFVGSHA